MRARQVMGGVFGAAGALLLLGAVATPTSAQQVTFDSTARSWTLRSGAVLYRLAASDTGVFLTYFGPAYTAPATRDTTAWIRRSYPPVINPALAGSVGGEPLAPASFRLVRHRVLPVGGAAAQLQLTMRHVRLPLEVEERLTAWGETGVITRALTLRNRGASTIPVDITPAWMVPGAPYTLRYFYGGWGAERQLAIESLGGGVRQFDQVTGRSSKFYVPWLSLRDERAGVEYMAELAWSGNWRMQVERAPGDADMALDTRPVAVRLGMTFDNGAPLPLRPGASFTTPSLALTASAGDLDDAANQMHRYQRAYVSPPAPGNRPLLVHFNSWYPFGQDIDIAKGKASADVAASLGAEAYIVDSGWYVDKDWVLELGDYQVSRRKFPQGLEELSAYVRQRGMQFGLWVEIEDLGNRSRNFRQHPDWCLPYRGRPVINDRRCQLDFANPAVRDWASATVERLITTYRLGWIKIDYNIDIGDRFDPSRPDRAGLRLHDHVQAYYRWLDALRARHPQLVVENCSSGALRFDTGIMAHAHTTWVSDVVHPKQSLQLGWGCTLQFSPELCNHWMVGDNDAGEVKPGASPGWWDFLFRVPMTGQFGISSRVNDWNDSLRTRAVSNVQLYKRIRSTLAGADVYHLTPAPDHNRPTGWMAIQYVAPGDGRSVVMAYRLEQGEEERRFRLRALRPEATYDVWVDGARVSAETGQALLADGLRVALPEEWRSAVVELVPRL